MTPFEIFVLVSFVILFLTNCFIFHVFLSYRKLKRDYDDKMRDLKSFKATKIGLCWIDENPHPRGFSNIHLENYIKYSEERKFVGRFMSSFDNPPISHITEQKVNRADLIKRRLYVNVETYNMFRGTLTDDYFLIAEFDTYDDLLSHLDDVWDAFKKKYIDGNLD